MKASEYKRGFNGEKPYDELLDYIGSEAGKAVLKEHDSHWEDVMKLAEDHGFIVQCAGGVAVLATHHEYKDANGTEELAKRLRMCDVEMGDER